MSIRLITMDGGHVTPEIDSFLYRALVPRIAPTGMAEDIPAFADYLLYGGQIAPMGVNVFIQKTVMIGCGRIIEIPDSETIQVPSDASGKAMNYTLVFRIQPSATNASDRVKAVFVPENGTFYTDDISTGTGIYDVKFAAVSVDETGWPDHVECILPKMPVLTDIVDLTAMEEEGQICIPTAEGVRKFVWAQNYFSKSSTADRLWLLQLVGDIVKVGGYFATTAPTEELDDLLSAYSVYYQLNGVKNSELWELFNCNAEGAFVSAFTYQGEENGHEYSKTVQIAIPCALSLTKFEFANIATRTKTSNGWTEWNIAGELDYTAIRNQLLATKLPSDITLDTLGDAYSVYFSLSGSENVDLYNAFKGQAIGAFVSATYVRDETETIYSVQRAIPVVPLDADISVPCVATRSKIHGGKWSEWNTSGSGSGGTDTVGGYYTPAMKQTSSGSFTLEFIPSKNDMPAVTPVTVTLPTGSPSDINTVIENLKIIEGGNAFTESYGPSVNSFVKWTCLGDSITDLRTNRPNNYPYWISYNNPTLTVQNLGIGGAFICFDRDNKLSDGSPVNSLYTQAKSIDSDTDIITVFGGVNDYNWGVPLGSFTTDLTGYPTSKVATAKGGKTVKDGGGVPDGGTFYQGVYRLAKYLRETFPDKPIVWFTPMAYGVGNSEGKDKQNSYGNTIYQFMDAVKEVTAYFSIPCYDLGRLCSITPRIQAMQDKYYLDNLHPNAAGSLIISRIIEREMKKTLIEWGFNL